MIFEDVYISIAFGRRLILRTQRHRRHLWNSIFWSVKILGNAKVRVVSHTLSCTYASYMVTEYIRSGAEDLECYL